MFNSIMENFAFEILYGKNPDSNTQLIIVCGFLLGAIFTGFFQSTESKINRSTFFMYSGFLTFFASFTNIPWLFMWTAIAKDILWIILFLQFLLMGAIGSLYILAAKQRALDAFGVPRYAVLAFIPLFNIYFMLKRSQQNRLELVSNKGVGLHIACALLAFICAASSKSLMEEHIVKVATPEGEQTKLILVKLREHLGMASFLDYYVYPNFNLPLKIDEHNEIVEIQYTNDTIVNTILHKSNNPPDNSEPFVSNVKQFICERWKDVLIDQTQASYVFVNGEGVEYLTVSIRNQDCFDAQ